MATISLRTVEERAHGRRQLTALLVLLLVNALAIFLMYAFFYEEMMAAARQPAAEAAAAPAVLGLLNAGIFLVGYGLLGVAGYWFLTRLALPGIFRESGDWRSWFAIPLGIGLLCGLLLIVGDVLFAPVNGFGRFVHPSFPSSILASLNAGIGEEILFRGFVFGLLAFLLTRLFRGSAARVPALWTANVAAALIFGAGHFATILALTGASSLAALSPVLIVEILLLNGIVGVIAGERTMKDGLIAAIGVHFWADIVFHVLWGVI